MITLSFKKNPLNAGLPARRAHLTQYQQEFSISADPGASTFVFELFLMRRFKKLVEDRRRYVDVEYYNAAKQGHRFKQGNSRVSVQSSFGYPVVVALTYINNEASSFELGPSNFCEARIVEIAHDFIKQAPRLITCDSEIRAMVESIRSPQLFLANAGEIVSFPRLATPTP